MRRFKKICILFLCMTFFSFVFADVFSVSAASTYSDIYKRNIKVVLLENELNNITSFDFKLQGNYSIDGTTTVIGDATYTLKLDSGSMALYKSGALINQFPIGANISISSQNYNDNLLTLVNTNRQYIGGFDFVNNGTYISIVNKLGIDEYLYGVVPSEISESSHLEALKAQAVAARTFAFNKMVIPAGTYFDLGSNSNYQVYKGYSASYPRCKSAVDSTKGNILTYNGKPVDAFYSASDGGYTEKSESVWSGSLSYIDSVPDVYDTNYKWTRTFTSAEINSRLSGSAKAALGEFTAIDLNSITKYISGRISNITLKGTAGSISFSKNAARTLLNAGDSKDLLSALYTVSYDSSTDTYTFSGSGYGHGVGMSQIGAQNRALAGKTYSEILSFYYPNSIQENYFINVQGINPSNSNTIVGQSADFTATATGGKQLLYQYYIYNEATQTKTMVQDYSTNASLKWTFNEVGNYQVVCFIKDINSISEYDDVAYSMVNVSAPPVILNGITPAQLNTYAGNKETITVSASGGTGLLYQYQIYNYQNQTLTMVQDYGTNPSFTWIFNESGKYQVRCFIKDKTSSNSYDKVAYCETTVNPPQELVSSANQAAGKVPTSSSSVTNISLVTDGSKSTNSYYGMTTGLQWIQLDLGASYNVSDIKIWHYFSDARKYHDVVVQLSNDSTFASGVTTVFNNDTNNTAGRGTGTGSEYAETSTGKDIPVSSVNARYARFYSNGSSINAYNHYVEVEVYGSADSVIHPTSVTLNKTADTLTVGGKDTLAATVMPANASNKNVTWTSSAPAVATVSSTGLVTAVSAGTAVITANTADGGYIASCAVTVNNLVVHPTSVSLNKTTDSIAIGATDKLTATVAPTTATNKSVTWSSSDATIASVASDGTVKGLKTGAATITARTADGGLTAACKVNIVGSVTNLAAGKIAASSTTVTNISLVTDGSKSTNTYYDMTTGLQWIQLDLGTTYNISDIKLWHYFSDGRKYHDVVVQLSNDSTFASGVTTVFNNDTNNTAGRGTGTGSEYSETSTGKDIPVSSVNARYARFYSNGSSINAYNHYVEVEVYGSADSVIHPASVTLNKTADTLTVGVTDALAATVQPADAANKNVTWTSSATGVATVSSTGLVTAVSAGTATITAKTADGGYTASCAVTVKSAAAVSNLAAGKLPTALSAAFKNLSLATDGIKSTANYADSATGTGLQWVQVDLGNSYNISSIKLWHYFGDARQYHDIVVQLSNDATFKNSVTTVFNNDTNNSAGLGAGSDGEYAETSSGKAITFNAVNARYARFYSNGSSVNNYSHYAEIEIYGK